MNNKLKLRSIDELENYLGSTIEFEKIYPRITERKATLAMIGINPRTYIHWKNEGLVDASIQDDDKRLWVRLNLYDYVWLNCIKTLRGFGIGLEVIKELKSVLDTDIVQLITTDFSEYSDFLKTQSNVSRSKIQEQLDIIQSINTNKSEVASEEKHLTSLFGSLIHRSLILNDEGAIIVLLEGDKFSSICFNYKNINDFTEVFNQWMKIPHVIIPIRRYIEEFMQEPKNEDNLMVWGFIDRNEKKVLDALNKRNFKEISIKRNNNEDFIIEETTDGDIMEQKAKEIRRILGLNDYSEITIKYRNDKHLYFKNKTRI
ncbi:MAG: hypothetical protein IPM51_04265 [Sphingobacteriaceae bacterium]|nr:hypothetical protein [Sphingobacteriaceae bacterium]